MFAYLFMYEINLMCILLIWIVHMILHFWQLCIHDYGLQLPSSIASSNSNIVIKWLTLSSSALHGEITQMKVKKNMEK